MIIINLCATYTDWMCELSLNVSWALCSQGHFSSSEMRETPGQKPQRGVTSNELCRHKPCRQSHCLPLLKILIPFQTNLTPNTHTLPFSAPIRSWMHIYGLCWPLPSNRDPHQLTPETTQHSLHPLTQMLLSNVTLSKKHVLVHLSWSF